MSTQHIGAAGEILVTYRLLKHEVDSARLTTDSGVDLVAYSPVDGQATTIQVKTVRNASPAGGRAGAPPAVGWWFPHDTKAQLLALVLLETDDVWLLTLGEARDLAQQHNDRGMRQLYWYSDPARVPSGARQRSDLEPFIFERRIRELFLSATLAD